jgi:hypothetical protein
VPVSAGAHWPVGGVNVYVTTIRLPEPATNDVDCAFNGPVGPALE